LFNKEKLRVEYPKKGLSLSFYVYISGSIYSISKIEMTLIFSAIF